MNENDLRDCFAMFALCGVVMRGEPWTARQVWEVADEMLEARAKEPEEAGIAAFKTKRKYARKN